MPQLPPMTQQDCAYFDFVEGLKVYNYTRHVTTLLKKYGEKAVQFEEKNSYLPSTMNEAAELIEPESLYKFACGVQRTAQQMMWAAGIDSLKPYRQQILDQMEKSMPAKPLGRLELHPEMELPTWYTGHDIHLTPGGYWGDELLGAIYQRSVNVYSTCWRRGRSPQALIAFARSAPQRHFRRILDMGCSLGGSTLAFRRAYPEAEEVIGIDLSAPALKWAHLSAEEQGLRITYAQRNAADTGYPSESFDLITAFLLLHEEPPEVVDQTLREVFRLLRPGGHVMFLEIPRYAVLKPEVAFLEDFDTRGNGEPFWGPFLSRDLPALLREIGFVNVQEGPLDFEEPGYWGSAALMRTGNFQAYNRWITRGDKPPVER
jgi:SAM-dependent methyltransferase